MSRFLHIAIVLYLLGLLTFYTVAVFDTSIWNFIYFLWCKLVDTLVWGAFYYLAKNERKIIKPIFALSIVRLTWEIVSYITGVSVNNSLAVAICFMVLTCVIIILSVREFRKVAKHI